MAILKFCDLDRKNLPFLFSLSLISFSLVQSCENTNKAMAKGLTLLEILIVLFILSITLLFTIPKWQSADQQMQLNKEAHRLYLFLRQIQGRAENASQIWFIVANSNSVSQEWCFAAQLKSNEICDCFNPQRCSPDLQVQFYYPYFKGKTVLKSPKLYPTEAVRLNGTRNTFDTNCFLLEAVEQRTLFSFFNVGSLKLKTGQAASACSK